nr:MAG TPA: hypothetical protein [Caudoviricetes sp.]
MLEQKPLKKPIEPPHGQVIKKPATMGGIGETAAWVRLDKKNAPGKIRGRSGIFFVSRRRPKEPLLHCQR